MSFWLLVFLLLIPLVVLINRLEIVSKSFAILSALTFSPLLLGWVLYILFYFIPDKPKENYLIGLCLFILTGWIAAWFLIKKKIKIPFKIKIKNFGLLEWILLASIVLILSMVSIRGIVWPPTWYDHLLYIKQSFVFSSVRNLSCFAGFSNFLTFEQNGFVYQMSSGIRPGLTMIYTLILFFVNDIQSAEPLFASVIIFYLWLLVSLVVVVVKERSGWLHGLMAGFFLTTCYYMINFSIYGYKELIIMCFLILALVFVDKMIVSHKHSPVYLFFLGGILGMMSFVGYAGTLIALIILFLYLILQKGNWQNRLSRITGVFFGVFILGASEIVVFTKWLLSGFKGILGKTSTTSNVLETSLSTSELKSYGIFNNFDVYVRGKFQGFTQIQFYGLIFWLFLLVLIFNWKRIIKNKFQRLVLVFIFFYSFLFFDPLLLNKHRYIYVLSASPKYSLILIPIMALIIGLNVNWLIKITKRIKPFRFVLTCLACLGTGLGIIKLWPKLMLSAIEKVVPLILNEDYYLRLIENYIKLILGVVLMGFLVLIIGYALNGRTRLNSQWKKWNMSLILFGFLGFLLPFLFFYNSNYGIYQNFALIKEKREEKLENIPVAGSYYKIISFLNDKHLNRKILLIGLNKPTADYFLEGNDNDILDIKALKKVVGDELKMTDKGWTEQVCLSGVELIFVREFPEGKYFMINETQVVDKIKQEGSFLLYECKKKHN